ncbi:MAG TPA: alpha/beta fold hydrolase [Methylibium sp.]|uniref:RBBP9/YdeN family alpha/beta hydrolase n=1 Tax=Methylibium sp. TaxID=2067992 RepID=UPI002DBC9400|nr:alpha/beta fold hydrolase [Methylibium sp.]HEU4459484.1 alpha/beta fold hydrolase [Methylibium sp.]
MTERPAAPAPATVLLLPGWQNSGDTHWQTRWEQGHGYHRVEQADWLWPRRGDWMARLDEVLLEPGRESCWLVAHSLGCQLVAAWAAHSGLTARVRGALLVAPPDIERADMPPQLGSWRPIVRARLPFAATVVASSDDPYATPERAAMMAADWDASLCSLGNCGHINGEAQLGDWEEGHRLLLALAAQAGSA